MKKMIATFVIMTAISTPAFAQPTTKESVKELLKITKSEQFLGQMSQQINSMMHSSIEKITQGRKLTTKQELAVVNYTQELGKIMQEELTWAKLEPEMIKIYAEEFSQEEIDGMIKFYKTPVGQSTIDKMPIVMQKSMQVGYKQMDAITPKIMQAADKLAKDMQAE
ncbi:hypothetical protein F909_03853 [Acinetobacter sp. ANC 3929]|uniref:DUF2059 domain-containing protein n=1 Tax=unclassified Acinetobacter TaxID=196816 RepID=UPI0002CFCB85|nr:MULTISPECIES: DUF2059 domain-containing protein [unclassified Acinetobacter]ENW78167.1 hypothetical protein F909_03853 [Acinetobacter sp. ANC 3929]MCH7351697.1 DUF2059 domain-containing protein [Acinetobacter sp. NIPH 2023]MCH7355382.1 DUF2059 domain-containing protein [Acinetobacter sp. NIPH 1958]MCH7359371.1 DUF2059 domain-containing protein [Acinetobacter sp. NIPH 2024]